MSQIEPADLAPVAAPSVVSSAFAYLSAGAPVDAGQFAVLPLGGAEAVTDRIWDAEPGESIRYFIGNLMMARAEVSPFGPLHAKTISDAADAVAALARRGIVELKQHRVCEDCYIYVATRRRGARG